MRARRNKFSCYNVVCVGSTTHARVASRAVLSCTALYCAALHCTVLHCHALCRSRHPPTNLLRHCFVEWIVRALAAVIHQIKRPQASLLVILERIETGLDPIEPRLGISQRCFFTQSDPHGALQSIRIAVVAFTAEVIRQYTPQRRRILRLGGGVAGQRVGAPFHHDPAHVAFVAPTHGLANHLPARRNTVK